MPCRCDVGYGYGRFRRTHVFMCRACILDLEGRKRALEAFISADLLDCTQNIGPRGQLLKLLLIDQSRIANRCGSDEVGIKRRLAGNSDASPVLEPRKVSAAILRRLFVEALRFVNRITSFERGRRYLLRHPEVIKLLVRGDVHIFGVVATLIGSSQCVF